MSSSTHAPYRFFGQLLLFLTVVLVAFLGFDWSTRVLAHPVYALVKDIPIDVERLRSSDGRVLYLGDSVISAVARRDTDKRDLATMLADELGRDIVAVSHPANAMDTYFAQVEYVARTGVQPVVILIPINLRSFGPAWEATVSYNFTRKNEMYLHPLLTRARAVLKWSFTRPEHENPNAASVFVNGLKRGTIADVVPPGLGRDHPVAIRGRHLLAYATDIERTRSFGALARLALLGNEYSLTLLFYATPIDWQAAEEYLSAEESQVAGKNIAKLSVLLAETRHEILDLSHALSREDFVHPVWNPHEHLRDRGRLELAKALAARISG